MTEEEEEEEEDDRRRTSLTSNGVFSSFGDSIHLPSRLVSPTNHLWAGKKRGGNKIVGWESHP